MKKHNIIYKITNIKTGQYYIGKHACNDINDNYMGSGNYIRAAIREHGKENFTKEILFDFKTPEEAFLKEKELVTFESCYPNNKLSYNLVPGGMGGVGNLYGKNHPMFGKHHTEKSKEKNRKAHLGKPGWNKGKHGIYSEETKKKMSEASKCRIHKPLGPMTEEHKEKIRKANTGRKWSEEQKAKLKGRIPPNKGKQMPEEQKEKLRIACSGRKHTKEEIEKQKIAQRGRIITEETKRKIGKGNKGKHRTEEEKQKQSERLKGRFCGEKNKVFGCKWMINDLTKDVKFVRKEQINEYLSKGYRFGKNSRTI